MTKADRLDDRSIEQASSSVYADLGGPDPDLQTLKAELVTRIDASIRARRLTQTTAARPQSCKYGGLSQPDVSRLPRGQFSDYSLERLLMALGHDVQVMVRERQSPGAGRLRVKAA